MFGSERVKLLFEKKKSVVINSYIFMEKLSPQNFYSLSSLFFLIKELAQTGREIIFEGGLVYHGILDILYFIQKFIRWQF